MVFLCNPHARLWYSNYIEQFHSASISHFASHDRLTLPYKIAHGEYVSRRGVDLAVYCIVCMRRKAKLSLYLIKMSIMTWHGL